jgi:hypothetical protein
MVDLRPGRFLFRGDAMKRLMISLLGAFAFAAAAQTPTPADAPPVQDEAITAKVDATDKNVSDRLCLKQTGTRIPARATSSGQRCTAIGRVYSRSDINGTGEVDMADALRKLDTSIH